MQSDFMLTSTEPATWQKFGHGCNFGMGGKSHSQRCDKIGRFATKSRLILEVTGDGSNGRSICNDPFGAGNVGVARREKACS